LLHQFYGDFYSYDLVTVVQFAQHARKEKQRQEIWQKWLTIYPYMTKDNFKPFEEYYKEHFVKMKTTEQINKDAERIIAKFKAGEKNEANI
jgi:hypothetical protein